VGSVIGAVVGLGVGAVGAGAIGVPIRRPVALNRGRPRGRGRGRHRRRGRALPGLEGRDRRSDRGAAGRVTGTRPTVEDPTAGTRDPPPAGRTWVLVDESLPRHTRGGRCRAWIRTPAGARRSPAEPDVSVTIRAGAVNGVVRDRWLRRTPITSINFRLVHFLTKFA